MVFRNTDKSKISFDHKEIIQKLFIKRIRNYIKISHFSINIFNSNEGNIFFSSTPEMAKFLCDNNFVNYDSTYNPEVYKKLSIYPWISVCKNKNDKIINFIKQEKFNMRSGMMIIRKLPDEKYVMYSFATNYKDQNDFQGQFYFLFNNYANEIAEIGDDIYNDLLGNINEYFISPMPKIKSEDHFNLVNKNDKQNKFDLRLASRIL